MFSLLLVIVCFQGACSYQVPTGVPESFDTKQKCEARAVEVAKTIAVLELGVKPDGMFSYQYTCKTGSSA